MASILEAEWVGGKLAEGHSASARQDRGPYEASTSARSVRFMVRSLCRGRIRASVRSLQWAPVLFGGFFFWLTDGAQRGSEGAGIDSAAVMLLLILVLRVDFGRLNR